jgi:IS5 family transposase
MAKRLLVDLGITEANGYAERETAIALLSEHIGARATVGADRGYDTSGFVAHGREIGATPHVAQNEHAGRRSALDARTTRHQGYAVRQRIRMRIESIFGWLKTVGGLRRTRYRGRRKTQFAAYLAAIAYNLLRIARLRECAS